MSLMATSRSSSAVILRQGQGRNMTAGRTVMRTSTSYSTFQNNNTAMNPFSRMFRWYSQKLETHPILTKGLTAGTIGGLGDVLCQYFVDKPEKEKQLLKMKMNTCIEGRSDDDHSILQQQIQSNPPLWWWEYKRTSRFFASGVVIVGPWCHAWFGWLARTFPSLTFQSIATRVALDQFVFTPVILSTFISSIWVLEDVMGDGTSDLSILQRWKETFPSLVVMNWAVWTPAQLFNFRFIPGSFQVLFANGISLVWNAYISFSTRGSAASAENEQEIATTTIEHVTRNPVVMVQRMTSRMEERLHATTTDKSTPTAVVAVVGAEA